MEQNIKVSTENEVVKRKEIKVAVYGEINGFIFSPAFPADIVREALSYRPRPDDIFIVSYPKCGTTWMQHIVYNILNDKPPEGGFLELSKAMPYLEMQGAESAAEMARPGAIKTHMPFHLQPHSKEAKYIYITRNPYDCCVSFYCHTKGMSGYSFKDGTFDEFFDMFIEGRVDIGDYFEHVLSWYQHRFDGNVLFVTYEDLKKDTTAWIIRIADFIGERYGNELRESKSAISRLISNTSVSAMQKAVNDPTRKLLENVQAISNDKKPRWMKLVEKNAHQRSLNKTITAEFVRKGMVDDWRNHFTPDHVDRMKERIAVKTAGRDVMTLWNDVGLP